MPTLKYRDPADGTYKAVPGGSGGSGTVIAGSVPIGTVTSYAGSTAPDGWHLCDGTAHGSAELEAIIGSANAPDLRDKFILGAGTAHAAKTTGGAETHTLTAAEMPSHNHNVSLLRNSGFGVWDGYAPAVNGVGETGGVAGVTQTGGGAAHNNMPPYYALVYIIKTTEVAAPGGITQGTADSLYVPKVVPAPVASTDAANKAYVDAADTYATADVALEAGWISWGAAYGTTVRLTRLHGLVIMEGTLNRSSDLAYVGNTMVTLGTLPAGYWPTFDIAFACNYYPNDGPMVAAKKMVRAATGLVQLATQVPDGTFKGGNTTVTMSGVWRAA